MTSNTRRASSTLQRDTAIFVILAALLTIFGIVMIYSASSIMALTSDDLGNNAAYYALKQMAFVVVGVAAAWITWKMDYHKLTSTYLVPFVGIIVVLLVVVLFTSIGSGAYGAMRWIRFGPVGIQPSEFAKATSLLAGAHIINQYFNDPDVDMRQIGMKVLLLIGVPLGLVLLQPDKGTVLVIGLTMFVMYFIAGADVKRMAPLLALCLAVMAVLAFHSDYSRTRIQIMRDPWVDEYGAGFQLVQGFYAFGSGGLTGVGLGMSRQKYSYLPMAHNDFIFAVIGEELGFVGTVLMLVAFCVLVYVGYRIASAANDLLGRMIAVGSVSMIMLQLLVNVGGVLGIIPLSGKPIPFISYGGSSIMSTLILVGLVLSVSRVALSERTQSTHDHDFVVYEGAPSSRLRVIDGGARRSRTRGRSGRELRAASGDGRSQVSSRGRQRIDLGPSASERLRRR